jgi:hypothetical protein
MFDLMFHRPLLPSAKSFAALSLAAAVAALASALPSVATGASCTISSSAVSNAQPADHSPARATDDFGSAKLSAQANADGADQIFQPEFVSARSVADFARNSQAMGTLDDVGRFQPLFNAHSAGADGAGPVDLRGDGLSRMIVALQSGNDAGKPAKHHNAGSSAPDSFMLVWEDTPTSSTKSDYDYNELVAQAAGAVPGADNVLIPLPLAAWSGLTVMGGVGIATGIKRIRRGQ